MSDFPDSVLDQKRDGTEFNYGRLCLADLFGVASYDETGKPRRFGYFVGSSHHATLWFIRAWSDWYYITLSLDIRRCVSRHECVYSTPAA
jgi:hypothetical protein